MIKSITFQIDGTGKVLVFPVDLTGDTLGNEFKLNKQDLVKVQDCLFNVMNNPHMYGCTAVPFNDLVIEGSKEISIWDGLSEATLASNSYNQDYKLKGEPDLIIPTEDNGTYTTSETPGPIPDEHLVKPQPPKQQGFFRKTIE